MEKLLDTRKYRKTHKPSTFFILCIVAWILLLFWILFKPKHSFDNDREWVELESVVPAEIYGAEDRGEGVKIYKLEKKYIQGTKVKPVAGYLYDKEKIVVDDEQGNRFLIQSFTIEDHIKGLRTLNKRFNYVYIKSSLKGESIDNIINDAGEYTIHDKEKGYMMFPQILVIDGNFRYRGAVLFYDEKRNVTDVKTWTKPYTSLFMRIPGYDKVAALNMFSDFRRFTAQNDYDKYSISGWLADFLWVVFDLFFCMIFILVGLFIPYMTVYPLFYLMSRNKSIPNWAISLVISLTIPFMIFIFLPLLLVYQNIWIWVALLIVSSFINILGMFMLYTPVYGRCSKCRNIDCIDVTEKDFLYDWDIIPCTHDVYNVGDCKRQDMAKENWRIRTDKHAVCICCGDVKDSSTNSEKMQKPRNVEELECPKCGRRTIDAWAKVIKNTVKTYSWSDTKKGDIKATGSLFGPDYVKKDVTTHYTNISGDIVYELTSKCRNCDYEYKEKYTEHVSTPKEKTGTTTKTTEYRL